MTDIRVELMVCRERIEEEHQLEAERLAQARVCRERIEEEHQLEAKLLVKAWRLARRQPYIAGRCRICGCSEDAACAGGCLWAPTDGTICDRCVTR